jgi:hypothetical protein
MPDVMMTVELDPEAATVAQAAERLGVERDRIDADFGVVCIDPDQNLYTVLVDEQAAAGAADKPGVEGPFSNPRIEPFGPTPQRGGRQRP